MGTIFVSHSEKNLPTVSEIVRGRLERHAPRSTGCLIQVTEPVADCDPRVLPVSANTIRPDQSAKEVVGAFERRQLFFLILQDATRLFVDTPTSRPCSTRSRLLHPEPLAK